ncbi:MAG: hypothetical protein RR475_12330 [Clostridia bacterium]
MKSRLILEKEDLRYLSWAKIRNSFGTPVRIGVADMEKKRLRVAENVLRQIAMCEGKPVTAKKNSGSYAGRFMQFGP